MRVLRCWYLLQQLEKHKSKWIVQALESCLTRSWLGRGEEGDPGTCFLHMYLLYITWHTFIIHWWEKWVQKTWFIYFLQKGEIRAHRQNTAIKSTQLNRRATIGTNLPVRIAWHMPSHHGFMLPSLRCGEGWFPRPILWSLSWPSRGGYRENWRLCRILRTSLGKTGARERRRGYRNEFVCVRKLVKKQVSVVVDSRCQEILCPHGLKTVLRDATFRDWKNYIDPLCLFLIED